MFSGFSPPVSHAFTGKGCSGFRVSGFVIALFLGGEGFDGVQTGYRAWALCREFGSCLAEGKEEST